nr:glycosyltransferase [uncultured Capnocytophaga sp.]
MRILIDNSNLFAGGGIQVATSFLNDLKAFNKEHLFWVLQSPHSAKTIDTTIFPENFVFSNIPEKIYTAKLKRSNFVKKLEEEIKPNVIFTTFGPSYHKSNFPKIVGFAFGQMLYTNSPFYNQISFLQQLKYKLLIFLKKKAFINNADALVFETENARLIFKQKTGYEKDTFTVHNTLNAIFNKKEEWQNLPIEKTQLDILCLTANYPHKNLPLIPKLIKEIQKLAPELNFKVYISLKKEELIFDNQYDRYVNYLGNVALSQLPSLYQQMDVLLMPSLLETFSTTYLEAMAMKVPIVASDMPFSRDICAEAALYCSPLKADEYAEKILLLHKNIGIRDKLIQEGEQNLKRFGTSMDRTKKYIEIIEQIATNNGNKK